MPIIQQILRAEIDPFKPVPEICSLIQAVLPYHSAEDEEVVLLGIRNAIDKRIGQLQGGRQHAKQIRQPGATPKDKK